MLEQGISYFFSYRDTIPYSTIIRTRICSTRVQMFSKHTVDFQFFLLKSKPYRRHLGKRPLHNCAHFNSPPNPVQGRLTLCGVTSETHRVSFYGLLAIQPMVFARRFLGFSSPDLCNTMVILKFKLAMVSSPWLASLGTQGYAHPATWTTLFANDTIYENNLILVVLELSSKVHKV